MKTLSILIPAFNEEKTILKILKRIQETRSDAINYQIIVINDKSTDSTLQVLEDSGSHLYDILISNEKNLGKGGSIKNGLKKCNGDYIIFQDADLEYDPEEICKFINIINKFDADVILGSRFHYSEYTKSHNFFNKIGNIFITFLFNILYNTTFTDIYCCYFCFKRELIQPENLKTLGFEQQAEILGKCISKSNSFYEVPVNYNGRTILEGKKIRFYHIFSVIKEIIKNRII